MSDHAPVSLALGIEWQSFVGRMRLHRPRKAFVRIPAFDRARKQQFVDMFVDGSSTQVTVGQLTEALNKGCSTDESITGIHDLLKSCCLSAFGDARSSAIATPGLTHAEWWNEDCAGAYGAMKAFRERFMDRTTMQLPAERVAAHKSLQKAYKRIAKRAVRDWEVALLDRRIREAQAHPRSVWALFKGSKGDPCPIPVETLTSHFQKVLNGEGSHGVRQGAHTLFNRTLACANPVPGAAAPGADGWHASTTEVECEWCESHAYEERKLAASCLNCDVSAVEVVAALKSMKTGKSPGLERVQGECYKFALRRYMVGERVVHEYALSWYLA